MRILYHFLKSPFSRRVRLALAHKGLDAELIEARERPELFEETKRRSPYATVPVLVEDDGRILADSSAITHYLDRAYADRPRLWPEDSDDAHAVFATAALVNDALDTLVAAGNRFYRLHESAAWEEVRATEVGRAQRSLDAVAARVAGLDRPTIARGGWSAADIWLYTATTWLRGLPERTALPVPRQLVSLGWRLPDELVRWSEQHAGRADVRGLEAAR